MSKTGRNDPCPCGSGKKYKKCCLSLQPKHKSAQQTEDNDPLFTDAPFMNEINDPDELDEVDDIGAAQESKQPEVTPYIGKTIPNESPEISDADEALVDAWWSEYKKLDDPDAIHSHLQNFFRSHPNLVENLELLEDVLFDLGGKFIRCGRAPEYIALLKQIREHFPSTYLKSFSYYQRDIIVHALVSNGACTTELSAELNWFKEYPDDDPETLFSLIGFLRFCQCDALLIDLLTNVAGPLYRSPRIIDGSDALNYLFIGLIAPYLDGDPTATDFEALIAQLEASEIPLNNHWLDPATLQQHFSHILDPLDTTFLEQFKSTKTVAEYYNTATLNFMGWLHKRKGWSWMKASFYRELVLRYLVNSIPKGKRPRQPFAFTKTLIDRTIASNARVIFSIDVTEGFGALNATYWFAEYLVEHDFITAEHGAEVKGWCKELWSAAIEAVLLNDIEAAAFREFPC